jgi:hypothetical protein
MGDSYGLLRFRDGLIMYWICSDCWRRPELYRTMVEAWDRDAVDANEERISECQCGHGEEVDLFAIDYAWPGRACRYCRCVIDFGGFHEGDAGRDRWDKVARDDTPDWVERDANIEPTSGGEAEPTQAYWSQLRRIIGEAPMLPLPNYEFWAGGNDSEIEANAAEHARELCALAERIEHMLCAHVTPELLDYAGLWVRSCREAGSICDQMAMAARETRLYGAREEIVTYRKKSRDWLLNACDAFLKGHTPHPEPLAPGMKDEIERFEEQDKVRRAELREELSKLTARVERLYLDSHLLAARLTKQHGLSFLWLESL